MEMQRPLVIAFASPKGGVGKSTSCLNIGGALAARGHTVHIIDLDQTQTLSRWFTNHAEQLAQIAPKFTISHSTEAGFPDAFKRTLHTLAAQDTQAFILLDLAGSYGETMLNAAALADLTITPSKLSEPDIIEATRLSARIELLAKKVGKVIRHRILINEVPSILPGFMNHVLAQLQDSGLSRFTRMIRMRAAYAEAMFTGHTPHYADQKRDAIAKAVEELDTLIGEIAAVITDQEAPAEEDALTDDNNSQQSLAA